jgi:hypothetical protein
MQKNTRDIVVFTASGANGTQLMIAETIKKLTFK